jgi:hypothetical protein
MVMATSCYRANPEKPGYRDASGMPDEDVTIHPGREAPRPRSAAQFTCAAGVLISRDRSHSFRRKLSVSVYLTLMVIFSETTGGLNG